MYRKILSVFCAWAIKAGVLPGCCGVLLYGSLLQGYAAPDTAVKVETAAKSESGDTAVSSSAPVKKKTAAKPVAAKISATGAKVSGKVPAAVKEDVRRKFVSGASAISGLIDRKLSNLSIPGLSVKKLLVLAGSVALILMTVSYYRTRRDRDRFMTTTRLSIMDKEVQRACRFIEEHFDDPELDLQKICDALVTGGAFLEALFVKELGLSIEDFIVQVRINRAKIALRKDPGILAADLVLATGFPSDTAFNDKFAAVAGVDLVSYREALGKSGDVSD